MAEFPSESPSGSPVDPGDRPELGTDPSVPTAATDAIPDMQSQYVKLAMRNMVRKRGTSIQHFLLTVAGLLGFLVGLSYLTR